MDFRYTGVLASSVNVAFHFRRAPLVKLHDGISFSLPWASHYGASQEVQLYSSFP